MKRPTSPPCSRTTVAGSSTGSPIRRGFPTGSARHELDHYVAEFTRTGFTGGINWYRNLDRNWAQTERIDGAKVAVPSLFIGGASDPVLLMSPPSVMDGWLDGSPGHGAWSTAPATGCNRRSPTRSTRPS